MDDGMEVSIKSNRNQSINCNVTNYTLVFVTILPRHKIDASGKIVTRIHVFFVTFLQKYE